MNNDIYIIYIFSVMPPWIELVLGEKRVLLCKTHIINKKGSKGKDKFLPPYLPSSIFDIYIYMNYI